MTIRFQRLSRLMIRQLSSGQRITEHGITAERTKSGDVRFSVNVMIDGQRIHRVIGRESEGVTREQAERAIETFKTKAREERLDLPSARKTHKLFREAASEYLDRLTQTLVPGQKGFADLSNKRRNVEKYLVPYFGNHHLHKIIYGEVDGAPDHRARPLNEPQAAMMRRLRRYDPEFSNRWWTQPDDTYKPLDVGTGR